ncbi:MAG TPA: argininosuccinate lyase [Bacteroidales bacterium]|jgi:argininosuccinate lyase|nr:argininosuccinate lyase [Bacteroidales bacterium]
MKLWDKNISTDKLIEKFTVGRDRELDLLLAKYDVLGSMAHIIMLYKTGLLSEEDINVLYPELIRIYQGIEKGDFFIDEGIEDIHSQVEYLLTQKLGDTGKKIHAARSRNDQVLLDIKLFVRDRLKEIVETTFRLFELLIKQSERYSGLLIPGYTHLQVAMPSSFGLWFGAYAESLTEDMLLLQAAYKITDQNPLGSAAGYGSSFPIDRELTTRLLGFSSMNYNVINAQMGRGKTEKITAFALASLAGTLSKMAGDVCLYNSQNFGFISLPDELTTGSSIMPHKKNPDVFELIRARCNRIQALPVEITNVLINLPSGYFRDLQVIKESFLPVFDEIKNCLDITIYCISRVTPTHNILEDKRYQHLFTVEVVNKLVLEGMPFRDAYKKVAASIADGTYASDVKINHTHAGSIGNLCNDKIKQKMDQILQGFDFNRAETAFKKLLTGISDEE